MTGSVKKYGPTWRIRWDAGMKPDGSRVQRSKGGYRTKREAEAALQQRLDEVRRGQVLDPTKITVGQFLNGWLDSKRSIRPSTRRAYEGHIRVYLQPHIGQVPLTALRADHLDAMYASIRAGEGRTPSAATMRRIHATLRAALNNAYKRRLIGINPAGQVELDPEPVRERDVWSPAQLATFLTHSAGDRLGAALHLIAFTGLRRGEACGLRWSDVDLDSGMTTIRQQLTQSGKAREFGEPKTRRGARTLYLDTATVALLRSHKAAQATERLAWGPGYQDHGLIFCKEDGSPLAPDQLSRRFLQLSEEAGVPRIVLHGLRHTYATNALAAGVPLPVVSKRLGHSKTGFTADTYMRQPEAMDQEGAELVARLVREAGQQGAAGGSS